MIRFVYNAGGTHTREVLRDYILQDLRAGDKALLLVPEQETVNVERQMLRHLPGEAQLCFEVLNFSRLADRTFRELGGFSRRAATPAVTALLMWRTVSDLLGSEELEQYGGEGVRATALCELMLQTAAQCKACCITAQDMRETEQRLNEEDAPLRAKLHDISLTFEKYGDLLAGKRFDNASSDLVRLAGKLVSDEGKKLYEHTHIYIDSFTDFTAEEMAVLAALFSVAPSVTVTFPLTRGEAEDGQKRESGEGELHLNAVHRTHRRLLSMAGGKVKAVGEPSTPPTRAHEYLAHNLFRMDAPKAPESMRFSGDLGLTPCMTPFDEADAAVTEIHRLVRNGCRYRDITVVVRESERWLGILDAALEREGIPFFISEKADVTLRPLIKLILEALRICLFGWREENVVGYLKTGLCGVSQDDLNLFEEYARVCHPRGAKAYTEPFCKNPDGFSSKRSKRGESILAGANRVRERIAPPLTTLFDKLEEAENATEMCRALYEFLEELEVRARLVEQASDRLHAGDRREAGELSRLYQITVDALEAVSTAIGDRKTTVEELADALKLVFSRTDIGSIPTATDEVTVGSASMLRADHPKFVLVLGLNEGLFPKSIKDDGLLSDADKRRYRELNPDKNIFTENTKLASDELFFLYRAFRAPTEGLRLFYSAVGTDGRKLSPSIAITRVKTLFDGNNPKKPYNNMPALPYAAMPAHCRLFTKNGAVELLPELAPTVAASLIALLEQEGVSAAAGLTRPAVERSAQIDPARAESLFADGNRYSPTHLEAFTKCRFGYYCDKVLDLRGTPDEAVNTAEVGNFIHHVLEHVMLTAKESKEGVAALEDPAAREALIEQLCDRYRASLAEAGVHITPRTDALFNRLTELARVIVRGLAAEFKESKFTPAAMELNLRDIDKDSTVTLSDGTVIPLSGQVDRVDIWKKDKDTAYLRVTDYKTGNKTFNLEDVEKGFCLQMPLYLMALCRDGLPLLREKLGVSEDTKLLPAGVCYFSSAVESQKTSAPVERELALLEAVSGLKRSGVIHADDEVQSAVSASRDPDVLGGKADKRVTLTEDGFKDLFATLEATIGRTADQMKSGAADAAPVIHDKKSPCDYCNYAAVCRARKKSKE